MDVMSDTERPPVPQYGEYAPDGYRPPAPKPGDLTPPPYGSGAPAPTIGRQRKTWDVVLTSLLLVLGLIGASLGCAYGVTFTDPDLLRDVLADQGYPGFDAKPGAIPAVLVISHVLLYLVALGGGILLLVTKRIAFWVPLGAGVVAAIIFWSCLFIVISSDPGFLTQSTIP
jgi:hypothetical protein